MKEAQAHTSEFPSGDEVIIPRVFHRIWLGNNPMPEEFVRYGETWTKQHPGWTMQLWTDENLPELINQQEFLLADKAACKADILRYEVIYRYGGVYLDTDFECLKNIEPLLKGVQAFAAVQEPGLVAIGIFGAERGHPLLVDLIARLPSSFQRHQSIHEQTGPNFFTSVVVDHPETLLFEAKLFYPYLWREKRLKGKEFPDAYAVHHWAKSWVKPEPLVSRLRWKLIALVLTAKKWFLPITL